MYLLKVEDDQEIVTVDCKDLQEIQSCIDHKYRQEPNSVFSIYKKLNFTYSPPVSSLVVD